MADDEWLICKIGDLIVSDIVRWQQPIWPERKRRKATKRGDRMTTAEILKIDASSGDFHLLVARDEIIVNKYGMPLPLLKKGEEIRRKGATIAKGNPQRLKWSDESARAKAASKFLN